MLYVVEVYLGPFHTSMMELFLKIVNGFYLLRGHSHMWSQPKNKEICPPVPPFQKNNMTKNVKVSECNRTTILSPTWLLSPICEYSLTIVITH